MRLSTSFVLDEFNCHSGAAVPLAMVPHVQALVDGVLQPVRHAWGPLIIISGYRSPEWNARVSGAPNSTHMTAQGADVRPVKVGDIPEFLAMIEAMYGRGELPALAGFGKYAGWAHLDVRKAKDGHLRRWTGKGMGSEPPE